MVLCVSNTAGRRKERVFVWGSERKDSKSLTVWLEKEYGKWIVGKEKSRRVQMLQYQ